MRQSDRSESYLFALVALMVVAMALNAWVADWTDGGLRVGTARVIDGDTFDHCDAGSCYRVRLCGINTPEREQSGYRAARQALVEMVREQSVMCTPVGSGTVCDNRSASTSHKRIVAQCRTSILADLAGELVRRGLACDLTGFTKGYYRDRFGGRAC
jgi:endonuclease YncB( thermonuclease family)